MKCKAHRENYHVNIYFLSVLSGWQHAYTNLISNENKLKKLQNSKTICHCYFCLRLFCLKILFLFQTLSILFLKVDCGKGKRINMCKHRHAPLVYIPRTHIKLYKVVPHAYN